MPVDKTDIPCSGGHTRSPHRMPPPSLVWPPGVCALLGDSPLHTLSKLLRVFQIRALCLVLSCLGYGKEPILMVACLAFHKGLESRHKVDRADVEELN